MSLDRELLEPLDVTPSSPERLARITGLEASEVEARLAEAERAGLVVWWGDVWATTWRAKWMLRPRFFTTWIPLSVAVGATVTALAVALYGGEAGRAWVAPVVLVAGSSTLATLLPLVRRGGKKEGKSG